MPIRAVVLTASFLTGAVTLTTQARSASNDAQEFLSKGIEWMRKGEYDKAIGDLDEAIRLDPKLTKAFNARGGAWMAKGEYDKAIRDLDESIRLDPKNALAFYNRA